MTASAIVAFLGSALALVFAVAMVAYKPADMPAAQPPNAAQFALLSAVLFGAFAAFGVWTSIGVFRLRTWARTSMLIFAGFLGAGCLFGLLMFMVVPFPPDIDANRQFDIRRAAMLVMAVPIAIAAWWLFQFNADSAKAAFSSSGADATSPRPLTVTFIAAAMLLGGVTSFFPIPTARPSVFLFGAIVTGWGARVIYAISGAISLYIGKGLLDLKERARVAAVGWFGLWFVHLCLMTLVPPFRRRLLEMQLEMQRDLLQAQQAAGQFDVAGLLNVSLIVSTILLAVTITILVRNRAVFLRAENARDWPGLHA